MTAKLTQEDVSKVLHQVAFMRGCRADEVVMSGQSVLYEINSHRSNPDYSPCWNRGIRVLEHTHSTEDMWLPELVRQTGQTIEELSAKAQKLKDGITHRDDWATLLPPTPAGITLELKAARYTVFVDETMPIAYGLLTPADVAHAIYVWSTQQ